MHTEEGVKSAHLSPHLTTTGQLNSHPSPPKQGLQGFSLEKLKYQAQLEKKERNLKVGFIGETETSPAPPPPPKPALFPLSSQDEGSQVLTPRLEEFSGKPHQPSPRDPLLPAMKPDHAEGATWLTATWSGREFHKRGGPPSHTCAGTRKQASEEGL